MSLLKDLHSSFWLDDEYEDDFLVDNSHQERKGGMDFGQLIKLSARRRAIANFVSILTGESIPVEFSSRSGENYTDGKKVVISADAKNETFDSDVGLALHEGSHILLSQFEVLTRIIGNSESLRSDDKFPILREGFKAKNDAEKKLEKFIWDVIENEDIKKQLNQTGLVKFQRQMLLFAKDMWNWVEDRRIDNYVFTNAPGYREYYIALYDQYFRTKEISKALESDEYKEENLASYSMRVINLLNESRDLDALKGIREIIKVLDLNNISRLENSYDALSVAVDVSEIIFNNVDWNQQMEETKNGEPSKGDSDTNFNNSDFNEPPESDDKSSDSNDSDGDDSKGDGQSSDEDGDETGSSSGSDSDEDGDETGSEENSSESQDGEGQDSDKNMLSKTMKKRVENQLQKQKDFMEGQTKKKSASKKDQEAMKAADQSGSEIVQVGKDVVPEGKYYTKARSIDCIVVKNLTKELIESKEFPMKTHQYQFFSSESVERGIVMGNMLGKKLKIRSEVRELKTMRQRTGRIERRLINELGYGMENVFGHVEISKYKKAMLYISIDASSSMFSGSYANQNSKWHRTMSASVAMAKAASMIDNLDVRIDFRATKGNFPYVVIGYDSTKDSFAKLRTLFPLLSPCGYTPEGLCFEALAKTFVPATSERDVYFVNISDGQPYFQTKGANGFNYAGHEAATHTKKQVDALRKKGIVVSSYYVEDSNGAYYRSTIIDTFKRMYGKDAQFINVSNVHEIAKTMNGKFLSKSAN